MKTVIITGASRGIGAETARLFAKNGYHVVVNYNHDDNAAAWLVKRLLAEGLSAEAYKADVSDAASCREMVDAVLAARKRVDVLVNNAGIADIQPFTDISDEEAARIMKINFGGIYNMCRAVARHMISRKYGRIINVTSVWGSRGSSCEAMYCASKAAAEGLSKALAKEWGPSGITVNCVAPGFIDTDMNGGLSADVVREIVDQTPLCRTGLARDVANAVLFLAGDEAEFVTGQVLNVDGGWQV